MNANCHIFNLFRLRTYLLFAAKITNQYHGVFLFTSNVLLTTGEGPKCVVCGTFDTIFVTFSWLDHLGGQLGLRKRVQGANYQNIVAQRGAETVPFGS